MACTILASREEQVNHPGTIPLLSLAHNKRPLLNTTASHQAWRVL